MSEVPSSLLVLRQFRVVFNAVKGHFQQVEKQAGIGGAQVWALSLVAQSPGMGVNALAHAMDIHQSTASNLVKALVVKELLTTTRSERDRRAVCLHITPRGDAILAQAPMPWDGVLPSALARLDPSTLERLQADLAVLIAELGVADEASAEAARIPLAAM